MYIVHIKKDVYDIELFDGRSFGIASLDIFLGTKCRSVYSAVSCLDVREIRNETKKGEPSPSRQ